VASLGTAVTPQQLRALSRLTGTVILALDPDAAGQNAAARTSLTSLFEVTQRRGSAGQRDIDLRIARLPRGQGDPDELIQDNPGAWEEILEAAVPAFDFFFERSLESLDRSTPGWREQAVETLLPVIQQLASPVRQATWIQRLSAEVGIDVQQLLRAMPAVGERRRARPARARDEVVSRTTARGLAADPGMEVEEALVSFLLQLLVIPSDAAEALRDVELSRPEHRTIVARLLTWQNYDYEPFREGLPEETREVADDLRERRSPLPPEGKVSIAVRLYLARLRQVRVQSELADARQHLAAMERDDQASMLHALVKLTEAKHAADQDLRELHQVAIKAGSFIPQGTIDQESGSW
jgi:DNA primase